MCIRICYGDVKLINRSAGSAEMLDHLAFSVGRDDPVERFVQLGYEVVDQFPLNEGSTGHTITIANGHARVSSAQPGVYGRIAIK